MGKFRQFRQRWLKPYRLILHEEQTYLEKWQMRVTRWGLLMASGTLILLLSSFIYFLLAWTPLKELIIPGYASESSRQRAIQAELKADSAMVILETQARYLEALKTILSGDVVPDVINEASIDSLVQLSDGPLLTDWELTQEEEALREQVEEEDRFMLQRDPAKVESMKSIPFAPVSGEISSDYDPSIGHFGVDFVAPEGSVIHAVDDGVVILASYTSDGGYVISIQHLGNRVSVYKHNKSLLVESGDRVQAGDAIAMLGGTGTHSTGPHAHFEWWVEGQPLDPMMWLPDSN
ncbi:MAG: M23 family metallopeptidase [Flavobacteriales bacterium]